MLQKLVNGIQTARPIGSARWAGALGLAVAVGIPYFFAAQMGLALLTASEGVAVFWPAAGIAAGTLIALGPWARAPVALAVIGASAAAALMSDRNVSIALAFGLCNAGEALFVAWLIKRSSPGPVFYTQVRMGLDGNAFTVYKFRSMPVDAEDASGPVWARDDDPRATAIGKWLRRHDIDELPQFWNVLRGDMSIVGPRPERPFFVEQFKHRIPQYMLRHKVKAGITGWAQVNGWRGNTSLEKRIEFDLYYIENWSLSLDFKIMWLTVLRGLDKSPAVS